MTTQVVSVKGYVSEDTNDKYERELYQGVIESSIKNGNMNLIDGINYTPVPVFTFDVSI